MTEAGQANMLAKKQRPLAEYSSTVPTADIQWTPLQPEGVGTLHRCLVCGMACPRARGVQSRPLGVVNRKNVHGAPAEHSLLGLSCRFVET